MSEDIKDMAQARRVITQLRGLVAEHERLLADINEILSQRPCQNGLCNELNVARALLREVYEEGNLDASDQVSMELDNRIYSYLDACDKPGAPHAS